MGVAGCGGFGLIALGVLPSAVGVAGCGGRVLIAVGVASCGGCVADGL